MKHLTVKENIELSDTNSKANNKDIDQDNLNKANEDFLNLFEDLEYEEQNLSSKNNLINRLLLRSEIDVVDAQWEDSIELLDGQKVKIRFLYAKEDTLNYNKTKKFTNISNFSGDSNSEQIFSGNTFWWNATY